MVEVYYYQGISSPIRIGFLKDFLSASFCILQTQYNQFQLKINQNFSLACRVNLHH